jgi:esterase/lipase superfamily enzyme
MLHARHQLMPSPAFGKPVHLWTYGHGGRPILAFPTAGGYAHEWQQHGVIDALADWIAQGRVRLYCPETNAAAVWIHPKSSLADRMGRHAAYEHFIADELVPRMRAESGRADVVAMGASVGALYAVNSALKHPELVSEAVGLSGRYRAAHFTAGSRDDGVYYSDPSAYVWNLGGAALDHVRRHTRITLVCGQGNHEATCLAETRHLARGLQQAGVPLWLDVWGHDVAHEWVWWRRQIRYHVGRLLATA